MAAQSAAYLSYLLRLWCEAHDNVLTWRASVESAQTGEQQHFATVDELFDFLHERMAKSTPSETKNT